VSDVPGNEILPDDQAKVFLSYSRRDRERAQRIADVLRDRHFGVFKDTDDILPTEEWRERLQQLIEEADTIVFLLSPHSVASEICAWEIELAASLNKRIAPIVIDEVDTALIPPLLARLNFIFCTERDRFVDAVDSLVMALNTDIEWIREHTRLAGLSQRWDRASRPDRLLLRGQDIADAEAWRDSKPPEAPGVSAPQAAFIARSRHGAGQRQRRWIAGALGVAVATLALAAFAWVQSRNAEAQRGIAEEQRTVAEEQRDVAEQRKQDVLERITASYLHADDRQQAVSAWIEATADRPEDSLERRLLRSLLAGLVPAQDAPIAAGPGQPFLLNGALHLVLGDGSVVALPGFPASAYETVGSSVALLTPTGGMRLHDGNTGAMLAERYPDDRTFQPCFVDRGWEGEVRIYSAWTYGYSACGYRFAETPIRAEGIDEHRYHAVCTGDSVTLGADPTRSFDADDLGGLCMTDSSLTQDLAEIFPGIAHLGPPAKLPSYVFPEVASEAPLWQQTRYRNLADFARSHIQSGYRIPQDRLREFALFQFDKDDVPSSYILPEIWENEDFVVIESLTAWGGTGGEAHDVCAGDPGSALNCSEIFSMSGFNGLEAAPRRGTVLLYGRDLESPEVAPHNLLVLHADGTLEGMPVMKSFGTIDDLDLAPDEEALMALTEVGIVTLSLAGPEPVVEQQLIAPEGALAIAWLSDGSMAVLDAKGGLHLGMPGERLIRVATQLGTADDDSRGFPFTSAWIVEDTEGGLFAVGFGARIQLFSVALGAPVSGPMVLSDEQLAEKAQIEPRLIWRQDGSIALDYAGRTFIRSGPSPDATIADFLDPLAPISRLEASLNDG